MIVLKFGGTSVGSVARLREAAAIALAQPAPRVVVVSAASGVTNLLLEAARAAAHGRGQRDRRQEAVTAVHAIHADILDSLADLERGPADAALAFQHDQLEAALDAVAAAGE